MSTSATASPLGLPRALWRELTLTLLGLGAVAAIGIGASGVLAWALGLIGGKSFVAGDPADVTYTPARCRELLEYAPHARSCEQAAAEHHFGEIVAGRLAAGGAGVLLLLLLAGLWRRRPLGAPLLPRSFAPTVATSLAGVAAALLVADGVGRVAFEDGRGAGGLLSGGAVALLLAAGYGRSLYRALR